MLTQVSSDEPNENRHLADCNGNACMIRIFSTHTGKSRAVEEAKKACVMVIISTNRIDLKTYVMKSHDPWIFTSAVMKSLFFTVVATSATKKVRRSLRAKKKKLAANLLMSVPMLALFRLVDVTPQQMRRRRILRTGLGQLCGARAARQRLNSHGKMEAVQSLL